jgi:hypothetical protein
VSNVAQHKKGSPSGENRGFNCKAAVVSFQASPTSGSAQSAKRRRGLRRDRKHDHS